MDGVTTPPKRYEVRFRPQATEGQRRGRWEPVGTADTHAEAVALVTDSGRGAGDYWLCEVNPPKREEPPVPEPKSDAFVVGYSTAAVLFETDENRTDWTNPFTPGTDQHRGFEEAVYDFTQK